MGKYAILIDAGFVKQKLGSRSDPMTADRLIAFVEAIRRRLDGKANALHRIYYYDAPPLEDEIEKPLNGGKMHLGQSWVARTNKSILERLKRAPYFALRLGELSFNGWKLRHGVLSGNDDRVSICAENLVPAIQQKGVDMRIGMDIASLTLKQHVDIIVLVTGDSDFVPAMKFARREGAQVYLVTLEHGLKPQLYEHADEILEFSPGEFRQ